MITTLLQDQITKISPRLNSEKTLNNSNTHKITNKIIIHSCTLYQDVSYVINWKANIAQTQQIIMKLSNQLCQQTISETWNGVD